MCFGCGSKRDKCDRRTCDKSWQTTNTGWKTKHGLMWFLWCDSCKKYMLHNKDGHAKYAKRQELNKKKREEKQREKEALLAATADGPEDTEEADTNTEAQAQGLFAQYDNPFYSDMTTILE